MSTALAIAITVFTFMVIVALWWHHGYRTGWLDGHRDAKRRYDCFDCEHDDSNIGG